MTPRQERKARATVRPNFAQKPEVSERPLSAQKRELESIKEEQFYDPNRVNPVTPSFT